MENNQPNMNMGMNNMNNNFNPNQNMNFMGMNNPMGMNMMNNPMGMNMMNNPMGMNMMNNPMGMNMMNNNPMGMNMMNNNPMGMNMMNNNPMGMNMMNNPMGGMGPMLMNQNNNMAMWNFMNNGMNGMAMSAGNIISQHAYANSSNSNSTTSTANNNQVSHSQELKSVLPRSFQESENLGFSHNSNIKNIKFDASTGIHVLINADKNITVENLLKEFVHKLGLSENVIGTDLIFLFNGGKLDAHSQETISKFPDIATITVFDQNNVIGA